MTPYIDKHLINGGKLLDKPPLFHLPMIEPMIRLSDGLAIDDSVLCSPTLILGTVNSGKTFLTYQIADPIVKQAEYARDTVLVFCAKRAMLDRYYRPGDVVISADSTAPKDCWNLFRELPVCTDIDLFLRDAAKDLFEDQAGSLQPFYTLAPADIFRITVDFMYRWGQEHGEAYDNAQLVDFMSSTPIIGSKDTPGWLDYAAKYPEFAPLRDYFGNGLSDQALGVISELRVLLNSTLCGAFSRPNGTFSAVQAVREGGKRIFLYYDCSKASHSALKVFRLLINLMLRQSMSPDNNGRLWFIADEFALLPKLNLAEPLSYGREYGFRMICALQSAEQLTQIYDAEEAKCLLSLFPNVITLRINDPLSRSVLSDRYGNAQYVYTFFGDDQQDHVFNITEPVISDGDFSRIVQKGDAIISMPDISEHPFLYHGHQGGSR